MLNNYNFEEKMIPVDQLHIDQSYQRNSLSEPTIKAIISNFNWFAFNFILANKRIDGKIYIVDGWHRVESLKRKSIKEAPTRLMKGLTREEEAKICTYMLKNRKPPNIAENLKASLIAGDEKILSIVNILAQHKILLGLEGRRKGMKDQRQKGYCHCFSSILKCYSKGEKHFESTIDTLEKLWYDKIAGKWDHDALRQQVIGGLSFFLFYAEKNRWFDKKRLITTCGGTGRAKRYLTIAQANRVYNTQGTMDKHYALAMLCDYNKNLRSKLDLSTYS